MIGIRRGIPAAFRRIYRHFAGRNDAEGDDIVVPIVSWENLAALYDAARILLREQVEAALWFINEDTDEAETFRFIKAALEREDIALAAKEYLEWKGRTHAK